MDKTDSLGRVPISSSARLDEKSAQQSMVKAVMDLIITLSHSYPIMPMDKDERARWLLTYCQDLGAQNPADIRKACAIYRQNPANRFMATSGALLGIIHSWRTDAKKSQMRPTMDGSHQPWDGGCTCRACIEKIPRQGFYKASDRHHRQDEYDREQADAHFKGRIEPSKLDDAEMRLRNELINRIVMNNPKIDREMARRKVMAERTAILYPHNKFAVHHAKLFPQITMGEP